MRVALVGSDCEENLGLSMIAASLLDAGHQVQVVPFNEIGELDAVADAVLRCRPKVVGLGIQFQHRSAVFLQLAFELRQRGFIGHITCGGQYPTMAWAEVLDNDPAIDSVVLHEGERGIVELCTALSRRESLFAVRGLALREPGSVPVRTEARALCADLDTLPFAHRYREPARHLGLAFRPVWGSRGCWGSCAFCAITTYYRDAQAYGGGRKLRLRSVENLADEISGGFVVDCAVNAGGVGQLRFGSVATADGPSAGDDAALACTVDPAPPQCSSTTARGQAVVENWRDSGPRGLVRSIDLALFDPPSVHLDWRIEEARRVCVQVRSDEHNLTCRWECEGRVEGTGDSVYWTPANEDDALCVVARGQGGVTVATLRASELQRA